MELKRTPFLVALIVLALAVAVELGKGGNLTREAARTGADVTQRTGEILAGLTEADREKLTSTLEGDLQRRLDRSEAELDRPGYGIRSLAIVDGLLLFTVALVGLALLVPERIYGRLQGIATLVASLLFLLGAFFLALATVALVFTMIGLFLAGPFGTIAYLALWGSFRVGAAEATLGVLLLLKIAFGVCLVLAQPRFLQNKGLVLLVLTSLVANVVVSFLVGFPPRILASITDVIGAIVCAVLAALWAIVFLVGSIVSIIKVLRITRASGAPTAA